jgi:aminoglycoside phosphotransferase family enzyme
MPSGEPDVRRPDRRSGVDVRSGGVPQQDCSTDDKVSFLVRASAAPGGGQVVVRETRTSIVFLTEDLVYKLKKPVRDSSMDFTTVSSRHANAAEELRLNRRLAPDVYLGVTALCRQPDGTLRLGGSEGEVVDWLVVMRRLADERFLDQALVRGGVRRSQIEAVADVLAVFYRRAETVPLAPDAYAGSLRSQILSARGILLDPRLNLSRSLILRISGALLSCVAKEGPVLRRARRAPLVEGHGDLRPEHIWLDGTPVIIDCLEFRRNLRIVDPLDELSFLALECERLGAPWVGRILLERARDLASHGQGRLLQAFYRCFRATLRASFALRHFLEPLRGRKGTWHVQARGYLEIARKAAALLSGEMRAMR